METKVLEKFLRYVKIDTQSADESKTFPSTEKQFDLAKILEKELLALKLKDVKLDKNCYLTATLPSNTDKKIPTIGFISHLDTALDMPGKNVNPQIIEEYDGKDIILNPDTILSTKDFPELKNYIGQKLITTDGTTLLGADDKAGIAEIMTAIEYLVENSDIKHGEIKIAFTPDEEIGHGTDHFDVKAFGADYAYTIDGGEIGELEFENFNAAMARIKIKGRNVHPGTAKNKMINSTLIAFELNQMLPVNQRPEYTENYEGFFLLIKLDGSVEETSLIYIIRDHDMNKFLAKKELITNCVEVLNKKYGEGTVLMDLNDQYFNMREKIEPVFHIIDIAKQAMIEVGVTPIIKPIRGGTDGSKLSFMGLPTPNIFTGGHNFHGKYEFIPVNSMKKAVEVILKIIVLYTKK